MVFSLRCGVRERGVQKSKKNGHISSKDKKRRKPRILRCDKKEKEGGEGSEDESGEDESDDDDGWSGGGETEFLLERTCEKCFIGMYIKNLERIKGSYAPLFSVRYTTDGRV